MKPICFLTGLLLAANAAFPQSFLNGGFESTSASADLINLTNAAFNTMMANTVAFGTYGDVDIITSSTWGPPQQGSWYVGLTGGGTDIITLKLAAPLVAGTTYTIRFYDRGNAGFPVYPVQLGLSTVSNAVGTTIYTGPTPTTGTWKLRSATFVAPNNGQYVSVLMTAGSISDWVNVDNFTFTTPLPVELISFSGTNKEGVNVLEWTTSSETNNDHFDIERSTDGVDFRRIGIVEGNGNSTELSNYVYDDAISLYETWYYRLKQVDFNGHYRYSPVIVVHSQTGNTFHAVVSVKDGVATLNWDDDVAGTVKLIDLAGRLLAAYEVYPEQTELKLNLAGYRPGMYVLAFTASGEDCRLKIFIN